MILCNFWDWLPVWKGSSRLLRISLGSESLIGFLLLPRHDENRRVRVTAEPHLAVVAACGKAARKGGGFPNEIGSILFRQKNRRCTPVCLRNDPELGAVGRLIGGQQAKAFLQRQFVFPLVFGANCAPIPAGMPA